jgi:predicted nucleic acid-binding Zn ribbon protein
VKQPVLLKNILHDILQTYHLEKPIKQHSSVWRWAEVVDSETRDRTNAVSYQDGKLIVEVESSTLRNELVFRREQYKKMINQKVGEPVVNDIVFINKK